MIEKGFRLDIQGLRALAVLSVVFFHISPRHIPGGYLGVDIFFVISGYLIIGQIWRKLSCEQFSFADFYANRFRRLAPSLIAMISVSSVVAYCLFLPSEFEQLANSALSSLFYYSNFWFYSHSGYFDSKLEFAPLLHTWSLSVEEQFYLLFPLILLGVSKYCKSTKQACVILLVIAVCFFSLSEWVLSYDSSLSFYASPTRFWQFMIGGIVAIVPATKLNHGVRIALVLAGLFTTITLLFVFNENTSFPGVNAVPITIATALIIYARIEKGVIHYALANKLSQFFGNISYSFYLWHWPVIVFYKTIFIGSYVLHDKLLVLIVSIVLGTLSYFIVETPLRKKHLSVSSIKTSGTFLVCSAVLASGIFALIPFQKQGVDPNKVFLEKFENVDHGKTFKRGECFITSANRVDDYNANSCINVIDGSINILLVGDSFAAHWVSSLETTLPNNVTLSQLTASGCKPTIPLVGEKRCTQLLDWGMKDVIPTLNFDLVLVSARWREADVDGLVNMLDFLKQYTPKIAVIGPLVEYQSSLPWLLARASENAIQTMSNYTKSSELDYVLGQAVDSRGAVYISLLHKMCPTSDRCILYAPNGDPMQFDYGHVSHNGAMSLINEFWGNQEIKKTIE
ncbi:acyltransferase family protein [Alteromonas gracilis]|uniref:acyltransferase family protein n=1 Tax=Alteromonas gracilis TaxID=1479524 RepID=UPI0030D0C8E6